MSEVTVKVPKAAEPFACIRRSGMTSRSKWASFSRNQTSCSNCGPRAPAVITFWLSTTGQPALVVNFFLSPITCSLFFISYSIKIILLETQDGHQSSNTHNSPFPLSYFFRITPHAILGPPGASFVGGSGRY